MTITSYQIDGMLKAYNKQSKSASSKTPGVNANKTLQTPDIVTLSAPQENKTEAFDKISYTLLDVLIKTKEK